METPVELIFHPRAIAALTDLRGPAWRELVERALASPDASPEKAAFVLMMARLNGCLSCDEESLRAVQGCSHCSRQTINKYKGSDEDLLALYQAAAKEISQS